MALAARRKIRERTLVNQMRPHCLQQASPPGWIKSLANFSGEDQLFSIVIPDQDRLETAPIGFVAADHKFLSLVQLQFQPRRDAGAGAIHRIALLRHNALEPR